MISLRNLNRQGPRGRILGTPYGGVLGALIPSTGTNGPAYTYDDLTLPDDLDDEICGRVTRMPATFGLVAQPDTSFYSIPTGDGEENFEYQLLFNGLLYGSPQEVELASGNSTIINCTVGSAAAAGFTADIVRRTVIDAGIGSAAAVGLTAVITTASGTVISCDIGSAAAAGLTADIYQGRTITCTPGVAVAQGLTASIIWTNPALIKLDENCMVQVAAYDGILEL